MDLYHLSADGFSEGLKHFKSPEERRGATASTLLAPLFSLSKTRQTAPPRSETFWPGGTPGSSPCLRGLRRWRPTWNQRSSPGWCEWEQSRDSGRAAIARDGSNTRRHWGDPWGFTHISGGCLDHRLDQDRFKSDPPPLATHVRCFRTKTSCDRHPGSRRRNLLPASLYSLWGFHQELADEVNGELGHPGEGVPAVVHADLGHIQKGLLLVVASKRRLSGHQHVGDHPHAPAGTHGHHTLAAVLEPSTQFQNGLRFDQDGLTTGRLPWWSAHSSGSLGLKKNPDEVRSQLVVHHLKRYFWVNTVCQKVVQILLIPADFLPTDAFITHPHILGCPESPWARRRRPVCGPGQSLQSWCPLEGKGWWGGCSAAEGGTERETLHEHTTIVRMLHRCAGHM